MQFQSIVRRLGVLSSLVAIAACTAEVDLELIERGSQSSGGADRIVNGQIYNGHPSVGKLTMGGSLCTATLIGKQSVVTAAHCVNTGSTVTFTVGGTAYQGRATRHPQYQSGSYNNDIAVVILTSAPSVSPTPINLTAPTVGTELTIIGYGKTSEYASDAGTKRMARNKIATVTPTRIEILGSGGDVGNICNGDSGGPSFATINGVEVQVGVHSTKSGACGGGAHDTRVDVFASWVQQAASNDVVTPGGAPPGGNPPPGGTTPGDSDPPQVAIVSPSALSTVPAAVTVRANITDNVGVTRAELHVDGQVTATLNAGPYQFNANVAAGVRTLKVVGFDAAGNRGEAAVTVTVDGSATPPPTNPNPPTTPPPANPTPPASPPPQARPGQFGAPCARAADCTTGLCADDVTLKMRYCTQTCTPSIATSCPTGATCLATVSGKSVCAPASIDTTPGPGGSGNGLIDKQTLVGGCSAMPTTPRGELVLWVLAIAALWIVSQRRR